jgi:hypothetical protein
MLIQCLTKEKNTEETDEIAHNEYHSQAYLQKFYKGSYYLQVILYFIESMLYNRDSRGNIGGKRIFYRK